MGGNFRRWPLIGGESRCHEVEGGAPGDVITIVLVGCFVLMVLDSLFLILAAWEVSRRPKPPVENIVLCVLSVLLHVLGWCIFLIRHRKCEGTRGLLLYAIFALMAIGVGFWVRLQHLRAPLTATACPARR